MINISLPTNQHANMLLFLPFKEKPSLESTLL